MSRLAKVALAAVAVLVVLVGGAVALLKSDLPRQFVERRASEALGRDVTIGGLDIGLGLRPVIVATDIRVANMETGTTPNMVEVPRAEVVVDLPALIGGQIELPRIQLDQPVVVAERDKEGRANWDFPGLKTTEPSAEPPPISVGAVVINSGRAAYKDPTANVDVAATLESAAPAAGTTLQSVRIDGRGTVRDQPVTLAGTLAGDLDMAAAQPFRFDLQTAVGDTKMQAKGEIAQPVTALDVRADIAFEAPDAYDLYQLTGIALPPTPPYRLEATVRSEGGAYRLDPFRVELGRSDIHGTVAVRTDGPRPQVEADLTSDRLDLGGLIGNPSGPESGESGREQAQRKAEEKAAGTAGQRPPPRSAPDDLIPDAKIDFSALRAADATVRFSGSRVESPFLPVSRVAAEIALNDGVLKIEPLHFAMGEGKIDVGLTLDARQMPAQYRAAITLVRVPLGEVLRESERKLQQYQTSSGTLGGRLEISGRGESVQGMLASAKGSLGLAMEKGHVGSLLIELAGLDAAESLGVLITGNKPVPLRCFIADFDFIDGIMGSRVFVLDTADTKITGEGAINFHNEQIDFRLVPQPKDVSLFSARAPVRIAGRLGDIKVRIETAPIATRLGLAALLGVTVPFAAPLAFVDVGLGKDSDCGALVREVRENVKSQPSNAQGGDRGRGAEPPAGSPRR